MLHNGIAATSKPNSRRAQMAYANTLARQGNLADALLVLQQARDRGVDPAWFGLAIVGVKSHFDRVNKQDIIRAASALRNNVVTLKHAIFLLSINETFEQQLLTLPDRSDMIKLFAAVYHNPEKLLADVGKATLARYYADHLAGVRQYEEALSVVDRSLVLNPADKSAIQLKAEILVATQGY